MPVPKVRLRGSLLYCFHLLFCNRFLSHDILFALLESSLIVQVLQFLINEAAESGFQWDSLPLLEFVAMNHDHENAAHFLEEITDR